MSSARDQRATFRGPIASDNLPPGMARKIPGKVKRPISTPTWVCDRLILVTRLGTRGGIIWRLRAKASTDRWTRKRIHHRETVEDRVRVFIATLYRERCSRARGERAVWEYRGNGVSGKRP